MKKFIQIAFVILTFASASLAEDAVFVPSLPDVPLPKGFEVDPRTGTFFDSAEGRIVEMYAAGYEDEDFIKSYYESVMANFGWQNAGNLNFAKEGEILSISFEKGNYVNFVKYQLRPNNTINVQ